VTKFDEQVRAELEALFGRSRSKTDIDNFRMGKNPWKKLSDEICPLLRFLIANGMNEGRVCFPLNDKVPDCWYWPDKSKTPIGIEMTFALGRERIELGRELVEKGIGRGFIGLQDDAPKASFDKALSRQRVMYSSDHALSATKKGILSCLSKKNKQQYDGMILIMQAPLRSPPVERWEYMAQDLITEASLLPFKEIYLIGNSESPSQIYKLK
jgi:hypothetical protein